MNDTVLLVMRVGLAALLLAFHGAARFGHAFDYAVHGAPWPFVAVVAQLGFPLPPLFAVASALAESVAAALVGVGLWTRAAAVLIAIDMAVAIYNEARKGDSMELAGLYFLGAAVLALSGPGRFSIDGWRGRRRSSGRR